MAPNRTLAVAAVMALSAVGLAACGGGDDDKGSSGGNVTMQLWENATTGPGKAFWDKTAADFHTAHPNVTIKIQAVQNEDLDGKLQTALNSGSAPDIFLQRGGGKMAAMVEAGQLKDITADITAETKQAVGEAVLKAGQVDGKAYALPTSILPGGLWYSKDLFKKAGIASPPTTLAELTDAAAKLKANGTPIALGAKDAWPAAHWYYFFALRACSQATLDATAKSKTFNDPCWTKAGEDLKAFADTKPFNEGFLTTSAQQGAGSSAGLLANHKAAMELMGAWDPGVIASLTPDGKALPDLGWFPFPAVSGGKGGEGAMMGGVDGFSCYVDAPPECADFLSYIVSDDVQKRFALEVGGLPVAPAAASSVTNENLVELAAVAGAAGYVQLWLDTTFGPNVGGAMNDGVVNIFAGTGDAQGVVDLMTAAAATQ